VHGNYGNCEKISGCLDTRFLVPGDGHAIMTILIYDYADILTLPLA